MIPVAMRGIHDSSRETESSRSKSQWNTSRHLTSPSHAADQPVNSSLDITSYTRKDVQAAHYYSPIETFQELDHTVKAHSPTMESPDSPRRDRSFNPSESAFEDTVLATVADDLAEADDDSPIIDLPAWSELKTKAGKERKRLPLACIACRRKKIRCSGEKPACKHCIRSRIPCVYKVSTRKAAPRTDYMAMLDKRLKRMEDRVIKIIPQEEQDIVARTGRANVRPQQTDALVKPGSSIKKRLASQALDQELNRWADKNSASLIDPPDSGENTGASASDVPNVNDDQNLLLAGAESLPPRDIQEHLAEVFFDYVYGQSYHLLHKPSFMRKLAQGKIPPVLLLSVCAVSARFSDHPAVKTEPAFLRGESWAMPARKIALERYDTPNITILIVFLILGLHEFGTCQGGRSWMLGGMAQRMAYALQLHRDLEIDPKNTDKGSQGLSPTDREIRRRTMWSCFLMDRFNSSGTDRPLFVGEQYIRAQLPIRESFFQMEVTGPTEDLEGEVPHPLTKSEGQMYVAKDNMGVAAYLIRLVAIWGNLVRYLNLGGKEKDQHALWNAASTFQIIKQSADNWLTTLPEALKYTKENLATHTGERTANQFIFMHIVYHQIILFMNRFALPSPGDLAVHAREMPAEFIASAARVALDAANTISSLVEVAMEHAVVAPFAGYCAFYSSTVHINGAFSKNTAIEAASKLNLARNVKYLTKMKKYWGMFHYMTENLRELYRRHADAARRGHAPDDGQSGPTKMQILQYGDWFDRYPHGVSSTDFDEPSDKIKVETSADGVLGQKSDLQTVEEFFSKIVTTEGSFGAPSTAVIHPHARKKRRTKSHGQTARGRPKHAQDTQATLDATRADPQHERPTTTLEAESQYVCEDVNEQLGEMQTSEVLTQQTLEQLPYANLMSFDFERISGAGISGGSPHFMSQLDRQMVLNSYGGVDSGVNGFGISTGESGLPTVHGAFDPFGLDAFSGNMTVDRQMTQQVDIDAIENAHAGQEDVHGGWLEPSTAWFMPFNVDPPNAMDGTNDISFSGVNLVGWPGSDEAGTPLLGNGQVVDDRDMGSSLQVRPRSK